MANTLIEYLNKPGNKRATLAALVGVPCSTITRAISGERGPSIKLAQKVEHATNGEVLAKDFIAACVDAKLNEAAA